MIGIKAKAGRREDRKFEWHVISALIRALTCCITKIEIKHIERVAEYSSFIVASNHRSYLDPPALCAFFYPYMDKPLVPVATRGLFVFPLNYFLRLVNAIAVDRMIGRNNIGSLKRMIVGLKKGDSLLIFPEGGINCDEDIPELKKGISMIVAKSRRPVIPVYITGSDIALSTRRSWLKRPKTEIRVGKPILFDSGECTEKNYQRIAETVRAKMVKLKASTISG